MKKRTAEEQTRLDDIFKKEEKLRNLKGAKDAYDTASADARVVAASQPQFPKKMGSTEQWPQGPDISELG